jgi:hypothetical protein
MGLYKKSDNQLDREIGLTFAEAAGVAFTAAFFVDHGGLAMAPIGGDYIVWFDSRESSNDPYVAVTCGYDVPTNAPVIREDLIAVYSLEVTQGLQSLSDIVELVEHRRTFVRMYVVVGGPNPNPNLDYHVTAVLGVYRNGNLVATLSPVNSVDGYINLPKPYIPLDRSDINQNFLF